jgi:hypothetical protein
MYYWRILMAKSMKLGGGGRFQKGVDKLIAQGKSKKDAKGIMATAGREKYSNAKMSAMAAKGKTK